MIWILFTPSLFKSMIGVVDCDKIGPKEYMLADMSQECFTYDYYWYTLFLVIPAFILYIVLTPMAIVYFSKKAIHKHQRSVVRRYQYQYIDAEYRKRLFIVTNLSVSYWELVRMAEKLLIMVSYESIDNNV